MRLNINQLDNEIISADAEIQEILPSDANSVVMSDDDIMTTYTILRANSSRTIPSMVYAYLISFECIPRNSDTIQVGRYGRLTTIAHGTRVLRTALRGRSVIHSLTTGHMIVDTHALRYSMYLTGRTYNNVMRLIKANYTLLGRSCSAWIYKRKYLPHYKEILTRVCNEQADSGQLDLFEFVGNEQLTT